MLMLAKRVTKVKSRLGNVVPAVALDSKGNDRQARISNKCCLDPISHVWLEGGTNVERL